MDEPSVSRRDAWRLRVGGIRAFVRRFAPFAAGVLAALGGMLLYNALYPPPHVITQREVDDRVAEAMASATPAPPFSEGVYQVIRPSLVWIQVRGTSTDGKPDSGLGSGVVVDDLGDILTSLHVVAGASEIYTTFADGTQSRAQIVTSQPENDIAVLHADRLPSVIVPAVLGNPDAMQVGDEAYVVGNPFGLYASMSSGVISGFNRSFQAGDKSPKLSGLIQFDAAVNPGNSGGPLLNRAGQVIGIVTGLANPTEQDVFIGIGFAMPITTAGGALGSPPD